MASLVVAETDFALNLLKQTPIESAVFSPLSIAIALSVLFTGAKDKTKTEIGNVVLKGANITQLENHFGSLVSTLGKANKTKVNIATRFFLDQDFPIHDAYRQSIRKAYKADAISLNFSKAEKAAKTVNDFVSKATKGKISQLVNADTFKDAVAVLINAIYFKAKWLIPFAESFKDQFHSNEKTARKVDFLEEADDAFYPYAENSRLRVAKIPYKNANFEFAIVLPKKRFGLRSIHGNITGAELQSLFSKAKRTDLDVWIDKLPLLEILKKLGITRAFSNSADFSLISTRAVKVSSAVHKAVIDVAEGGTEAAAATAIGAAVLSGKVSKPLKFHADHPFLYAVLYKNRPLFLGQYF